ncbi:MAG: hypothetical protein GZ088_00590 [Acidipila sp.]|nr:hypothetical protein [Acidipila sp.]
MPALASDLSSNLPNNASGFCLPGWAEKPHWPALLVLLILWATHVVATWGEATPFSGDYGRWLHEMDRFAHGEVPYRDFSWGFPPMSLWILGTTARWFGSDVETFRIITVTLSLLIYVAFFKYASNLLPRKLVLPAVIACCLLSVAYAQRGSVPLPAGMYIPAAPLGFLFLLCAVLLVLHGWRAPSKLGSSLTGVFCGLCLLTKQDFWLPAIYLVAVDFLVGVRGKDGKAIAQKIWAPLCFLMTAFGGILIVAHQSGWKAVERVPGGFGLLSEFGGRGLPSWERLAVEAAELGLLLVASLACLLVTQASSWHVLRKVFLGALLLSLLAGSIHVSMRVYGGVRLGSKELTPLAAPIDEQPRDHVLPNRGLLGRAIQELLLRSQVHLLPVLLPVFAFALVLLVPRNLESPPERRALLFLLGLCIVCRARRLFEYTEWYYFLLEIPVYLWMTQLLLPDSKEKVLAGLRLAIVGFILVGAYSYWFYGMGNFTRRGVGVAMTTPRGVVRVGPGELQYYTALTHSLGDIDPGGERPLFVYGYSSGGFNYFLNRRNLTPLTQGFWFSNASAENVLVGLQSLKPGPIVLDNTYFLNLQRPSVAIDPFRWDLKMQETSFSRFDRPLFLRLVERCRKVEEIPSRPPNYLTVYDCNP